MKIIKMIPAVLAVVGLDQYSKATTQMLLDLGESAPLIPKVLGFTYVQNRGAAFSSFQGMQWLFAALFVLLTAGMVYEFIRKKLGFTDFDRWCILLIWAGGLGNMIDRVRLGYVVDMIQTLFVNFPVFNVADIFITCGCIALIVHLVFFNKAFWKEEKHDTDCR